MPVTLQSSQQRPTLQVLQQATSQTREVFSNDMSEQVATCEQVAIVYLSANLMASGLMVVITVLWLACQW